VRTPRCFWGRTLRARLTLLLTALLLAGCATVGFATTVAVQHFLMGRLDQQLALAGNRYALSLEHNDKDVDNHPETTTIGQAVGTLGARLLNRRVTAVGVVADAQSPVVISEAARVVIQDLASAAGPSTVFLPGLGDYRVQVTAGQDGDLLVAGLPIHPVQEILQVIILTEVIVFVTVVLVTGVIGGLAVRRALRPLEKVAATALRVSELPLSSGDVQLHHRVPAGDEHTEVGKVASAVNHMLVQIESALIERQRSEDRLRQFVADASHELRTPLAVVRSHAELISLDSTNYPALVRDSLASINSGTRRMGRLVDDLLLLARLDSGLPLHTAPVDLTRLAIDSVSDARVAGPDHNWALDLPEEPVIASGDQEHLHQVMVNLLANARLHTPPGTRVTVLLAETPTSIELRIADDGPGIPDDLLPSVTERFVRGSSGRSTVSGSGGLGLPIVAGIVAAHGGRLTISSSPGGTVALVTLPSSESE
jgi:two-component system OmpR family sensor kinase